MLPAFLVRSGRDSVADPDLERRGGSGGGGGGLDLLALLAIFPFCHFFFFYPKQGGLVPLGPSPRSGTAIVTVT